MSSAAQVVDADVRLVGADAPMADADADARLVDFIDRHSRLFVLTGAGCSTESGIPDYRDAAGGWKRPQPVMLQAFMDNPRTRQRYWARSLIGWRRFRSARPNAAHLALARLERAGRIELLLTQNVDRLHQAAGSEAVIDLHGRLDQVRCMRCGGLLDREHMQVELLRRNAEWPVLEWAAERPDSPADRADSPTDRADSPTDRPDSPSIRDAPDGDADLEGIDFSGFEVPPCPLCAGILKPHVVFFGESVPPQRVDAAMRALERADAMLVVGSSLMVYSGYRFAEAAARAGIQVAAVNLGRTRADDLLALKVEQPCTRALASLLAS